MSRPGLGYLPDPDQDGDWELEALLGAALAAPPDRASSNRHVLGILHQHRNDCVSHGGFQAVRTSHSLQGVEAPPLGSRERGYLLARLGHGARRRDEGTYLRAFFDALRLHGFCPESAWPYGGEVRGVPRWQQLPSDEAERLAYDQISPLAYYRIGTHGDERIRDVKRAIAAGKPVCFGTSLQDSFFDVDSMEPIDPPGLGVEIIGGHAMCWTAYDELGAIGPNSWGERWGGSLDELDPYFAGILSGGGWFRMSWDYIAHSGTRDLWAVDAPPPFPREQT